MRNYYYSVIQVIALLVSASVCKAQPVTSSKDYVLIFPRTGEGMAGNIIRIDPDTVVVFTTNFNYIAKKDIGKVILHPKHESGKGFVTGAIAVTYGVNYLLGSASGQPARYLSSNIYGGSRYDSYYNTPENGSILGIVLLGLLFGGGIGYLTDHSSEDDIVFLFEPNAPDAASQWEDLASRILHGKRQRNYRFNTSGGVVFSSVQNKYYDDIKAAGFTIQQYYNGSFSPGSPFSAYSYGEAATDFNWLRSLSLSRRIDEHYEAGITVAWLGEPSFLSTSNSGGVSSSDRTVGQRFGGNGYYATGTYGMFLDNNENFEATFTAGLGFAKIDFDLTSQAPVDTVIPPGQVIDRFSVHKNYFSAMASAGISYYLYNSLSFGLSANYFLSGSETAKAMPFVGIKEHQLSFSNADIGFTIGFHF